MAELEFRIARLPVRTVSLLQIHEEDSREWGPLAARAFAPADSGDSEAAGPRAFAIGPREWLLIDYPFQEVRRRLAEDLGRALIRVTDITAAFVSFRVEGNMARAVLASDIGAPWAAERFGPGQCARTRLGQVDVVLHCIGPETFELLADRSIAEHLETWLAAQYAAQSTSSRSPVPASSELPKPA